MTDEEAIKAVEICNSKGQKCENCPLNEYKGNDCISDSSNAVLEIVRRQEAEITELKRICGKAEQAEKSSSGEKVTRYVAEAVGAAIGADYETAREIVDKSFFPELISDMPEYVSHYDAEYWVAEIIGDIKG